MNENEKKQYELFCPICQHSVGVEVERTETYHQHVAYCRNCKTEFVVNFFKATAYKTGGVKV